MGRLLEALYSIFRPKIWTLDLPLQRQMHYPSTNLKFSVSIYFGQVEIFSGKQMFDITCPTCKLLKKLISSPDQEQPTFFCE